MSGRVSPSSLMYPGGGDSVGGKVGGGSMAGATSREVESLTLSVVRSAKEPRSSSDPGLDPPTPPPPPPPLLGVHSLGYLYSETHVLHLLTVYKS